MLQIGSLPAKAEYMRPSPIYLTPGNIPNRDPYKYVPEDLYKTWKQPKNISTNSELVI